MEVGNMSSVAADEKKYRLLETRPRVLANFFRESRDNWKRKYQEAKSEFQAFRGRIRDLELSRAKWRDQAEQSQSELQRLEQELRHLKEKLASGELRDEKKVMTIR